MKLEGEHDGGCHCGAVRYRAQVPADARVRRPYDFAEVPVFDGVNHPGDTGVARYAGTMRFEPGDS